MAKTKKQLAYRNRQIKANFLRRVKNGQACGIEDVAKDFGLSGATISKILSKQLKNEK